MRGLREGRWQAEAVSVLREQSEKQNIQTSLKKLALALIKRQKAEIERLYKEIGRISKMTVETNVKEMTEGGDGK